MIWTDAQTQELRTLAALPQKFSAAVLAGHFDTTRNSIISRCRRSGIKLQGQKFVGRPREPGSIRSVRAKTTPKPKPAPKPLRNNPVSLLDLKFDDCRYPIQDSPFLFCGEEQMQMGEGEPRSSYCRFHHMRCTQRYSPKVAA